MYGTFPGSIELILLTASVVVSTICVSIRPIHTRFAWAITACLLMAIIVTPSDPLSTVVVWALFSTVFLAGRYLSNPARVS